MPADISAVEGYVMATNFVDDLIPVKIADRKAAASFEHRFFLVFAVLFPIVTVIGFAPTYYFKTFFNGPPLPSLLVHAHGLVMSLWIVLFTVQAFLISARNIKLHISLGFLGITLAVAVVILGVWTGCAALARGSAFPGYTPEQFFMVPVGNMLTFTLVFGAAVYYRRDAATHKRLMLVTMLNFLDPSIGRLPFQFVVDLGTIWFFAVPDTIAVALLAADTYRTGKLNKPFAAATAFMTIWGPVRMLIARTDTWTHLAQWIAIQFS